MATMMDRGIQDVGNSGDHPPSRRGHTLMMDGDYMYLIGGSFDIDNIAMDLADRTLCGQSHDVWRYHLLTSHWEHLGVRVAGLGLNDASAFICEGVVILINGTRNPRINGFRIASQEWFTVGQYNESYDFMMQEVGKRASVRSSDEGCMYIISSHFEGGMGTMWSDAVFRRTEVRKLSLTQGDIQGNPDGHQGSWPMVETTGECTSIIWRNTILYYKQGIIYIIGDNQGDGFQSIGTFNTHQSSWGRTATLACPNTGEWPSSRRFYASVTFDGSVYIMGGLHESTILNDVWRLNIDTLTWKKLDLTLPLCMFDHRACVTQEGCVLIFGGFTSTETETENSASHAVFKIWLKAPSLQTLSMLNVGQSLNATTSNEHLDLLPANIAQRFH